MLKRDITYEDFNGETVTETFYFNLTKTEIIGLQFSQKQGLEAFIGEIMQADDKGALITEFQKVVLDSYGQRSEDGKRFIKSPQLREEFAQSAAYDALFFELITDPDALTEFVKGIVPRDMAENVTAEFAKAQQPTQTVSLPPPPVPRSNVGLSE